MLYEEALFGYNWWLALSRNQNITSMFTLLYSDTAMTLEAVLKQVSISALLHSTTSISSLPLSFTHTYARQNEEPPALQMLPYS